MFHLVSVFKSSGIKTSSFILSVEKEVPETPFILSAEVILGEQYLAGVAGWWEDLTGDPGAWERKGLPQDLLTSTIVLQ